MFVFAVFAIFNVKKILKDKYQKRMFCSICIFLISIFIMISGAINWEKIPKFLWNIQFTWRFCTFISLGISIIAGLGVIALKDDAQKLAIIIICAVCLGNSSYVINNGNLVLEDLAPYLTEEAVSSLSNRACGSQKEYLPVNAKNNINYISSRDNEVLVKSGEATVSTIKNDTPYLEFSVETEGEVELELPRLFYFGYEIVLENEDGEKSKIEYYENDKGLIEIKLEGSGTVTVKYTGTTLNKFANVLSVLTIIAFLVYFIVRRKK